MSEEERRKLAIMMMSSVVSMMIKESAEDAQVYDDTWKLIKMVDVVVVKGGMESGRPSVDLQFIDMDGNKYVAMVTANISMTIGNLVEAATQTSQ